jgi:hypothetical protein
MPGLTGHSTHGVGQDLVNYLDEVAHFFGVTIRVTSGYRSPDGQAKAMFDNWENLNHGKVYRASTLPPADRDTLDGYWAASRDPKSSAQDRSKAKADFLQLAKDKVGSRSAHTRGRALDVSRDQIDARVYQAITLRLKEVKEGTRTDIYHFESQGTVPPVDDAMKAKWQAIKSSSPAPAHGHRHPAHHPHHPQVHHPHHPHHGHPHPAHHGHEHHGCC